MLELVVREIYFHASKNIHKKDITGTVLYHAGAYSLSFTDYYFLVLDA